MNIKELNKNQQQQINKVVTDYLKEEFKEYYKNIKENFNLFNDVTYKVFINRLKDLVVNGFDEETKTLTDDYYFYTLNHYDNLSFFLDNITEEDTEELLNFDEENNHFNENIYYEDDYLIDTLNGVFYDGIIDELKSSYSQMYISISDEEVFLNTPEDFKYYSSFKEYLEELKGNLVYDIDKKELIKKYLSIYNDEVYKWFVNTEYLDKEIKTTIKTIKEEIKKELKKRLNNNKEDLKVFKQELKVLKKLYKETVNNKNKSIKSLNNENVKITEALK